MSEKDFPIGGNDVWGGSAGNADPNEGMAPVTQHQEQTASGGFSRPQIVWMAFMASMTVFFAFFMRLMALGITVAVNPNDEAQIGLMLGIGPYIPHIVVVLALLGVTIVAARRVGAGWAANVLAYLVGSATITAIVYLDTVIGRIL